MILFYNEKYVSHRLFACLLFFQYLQAFKLICQNRVNENGENYLSIYQQKLNNILGTKTPLGVTV